MWVAGSLVVIFVVTAVAVIAVWWSSVVKVLFDHLGQGPFLFVFSCPHAFVHAWGAHGLATGGFCLCVGDCG